VLALRRHARRPIQLDFSCDPTDLVFLSGGPVHASAEDEFLASESAAVIGINTIHAFYGINIQYAFSGISGAHARRITACCSSARASRLRRARSLNSVGRPATATHELDVKVLLSTRTMWPLSRTAQECLFHGCNRGSNPGGDATSRPFAGRAP
jgi:hypothetical protein